MQLITLRKSKHHFDEPVVEIIREALIVKEGLGPIFGCRYLVDRGISFAIAVRIVSGTDIVVATDW